MLWWFTQVVVRIRPMFDVEQEAGETYGVEIMPGDPRRLQVGSNRAVSLQNTTQLPSYKAYSCL